MEYDLLSTVMLVTGYVGEAGLGNAAVWGVSGAAYFAICYILWFGSAGELANKAGGAVLEAFTLKWFVLVGWAIIQSDGSTEGWYSGIFGGLDGSMQLFTTLVMLSTRLVSDLLFITCSG